MKAQHTPGPWKAQQDLRSFKNNGIITDGPFNWGIYSESARVAVTEETFNDSELAANAALIAAAPDLLEALENIIYAAAVGDAIDYPEIVAAINRAKGESV